jgi:hypothetical protein
LRRLRELHLTTDDQVQSRMPLGLDVRTHDTGERTLVGDGQRGIAQLRGTSHQLFGVRRTAQKAEVAATVEFGVAGKHVRFSISSDCI